MNDDNDIVGGLDEILFRAILWGLFILILIRAVTAAVPGGSEVPVYVFSVRGNMQTGCVPGTNCPGDQDAGLLWLIKALGFVALFLMATLFASYKLMVYGGKKLGVIPKW